MFANGNIRIANLVRNYQTFKLNEMKKIVIKLDQSNIKSAAKELRKIGFSVQKYKDAISEVREGELDCDKLFLANFDCEGLDWKDSEFGNCDFEYVSNLNLFESLSDTVYQMPQDCDKIKAALGIKEEPKESHKTISSALDSRNEKKLKARIEELEKENKRLNHVVNTANNQAALVMNENRELLDENNKLRELNSWQGNRISQIEEDNSKLFEMARIARRESFIMKTTKDS